MSYGKKDVKSVTRWSPNPAPVAPEQLPDYLFNELNRLSDILFNIGVMRLEKTYVDPGSEAVRPTKPRDGDIRYADGTKWNPGSGTGIYFFDGTNWTKL